MIFLGLGAPDPIVAGRHIYPPFLDIEENTVKCQQLKEKLSSTEVQPFSHVSVLVTVNLLDWLD